MHAPTTPTHTNPPPRKHTHTSVPAASRQTPIFLPYCIPVTHSAEEAGVPNPRWLAQISWIKLMAAAAQQTQDKLMDYKQTNRLSICLVFGSHLSVRKSIYILATISLTCTEKHQPIMERNVRSLSSDRLSKLRRVWLKPQRKKKAKEPQLTASKLERKEHTIITILAEESFTCQNNRLYAYKNGQNGCNTAHKSSPWCYKIGRESYWKFKRPISDIGATSCFSNVC